MPENQTKTLSFSQAWHYHLRAMNIWWQRIPGIYFAVLFSSLIDAASPMITIYFSARIIGELAGSRNPAILFKWILFQLFTSAGLLLAGSILRHYKEYLTHIMQTDHGKLYMDKMQSLDYADVDNQEIFDQYTQIRQNSAWTNWGLMDVIHYFEKIVTALVQIAGGIGLSVSLFSAQVPDTSSLYILNSPLFIIIIIIGMLFISVLASVCTKKANNYWNKYVSNNGLRLANLYLTFFGFLAFDRKRALDLRIYKQQENVCRPYMKESPLSTDSIIAKEARGPLGFWAGLAAALPIILTGTIYLFACLKALAGAFDIGFVTQYIGAANQLFLGISSVFNTVSLISFNGEFLVKCFAFLDIPNNMYQGSLTTEKRNDRQYDIEFKNVSFKYPNSDVWALRHVNIKFRIGSRLAIVGMNGSGKTTFIKLLCRLYDPTEGEILLNGINIRKYRYDDYINIFSVVFQDYQLLSRTLGENVAGSTSYDKKLVSQCLEHAGFKERLQELDHGLETYLYKDLDLTGIDISGGEAQKIAIARAIYKDAPFMILDEPTAALDPVAEAEIYSKFNELVEDKTTIYISHRLSSCVFCDEIAVFHEGQIIEQGRHEALLADTGSKYAELWHAQAQYYTNEQ